MAIVNKPNTFSGNTTISSSEVNSNFDTLYNEFNGSISAANLADDAVTAAKLADNAVVAANIDSGAVDGTKLSTSAIKLGYAQITSSFTTTSTSPVQVTGLTATVTIPSGGRSVKITTFAYYLTNSGVANTSMSIWDGTVGSGTLLAQSAITAAGGNYLVPATAIAIVTPSASTKTYNVALSVSAGTGTLAAAAPAPSFILVELI